MNSNKFPATDSEPAAGDAARRPGGTLPAAQRETAAQRGTAARGETASRRAVGVYERPAQRAGLSRPLLVIMILAALVSAIVTARFLF